MSLFFNSHHTNNSHGLVTAVVDDCNFVELYCFSHLLLSFPWNKLYHLILICASFCNSGLLHRGHFFVNDCFILCSPRVVRRMLLHI